MGSHRLSTVETFYLSFLVNTLYTNIMNHFNVELKGQVILFGLKDEVSKKWKRNTG